MNEKIKRLLEMATTKSHWSTDESRYLVNFVNQEKFAQLVIEHCAELCSKHYVGAIGTHASAHNSAVQKCHNAIKELVE